MRIDNSRAKAWFTCPAFYYERYVMGIQPNRDGYAFGKRTHQLQEERHRRMKGEDFTAPICADELVEAEARTMMALYEAHYPVEPFDVVAVEQYFELPLPCPECGALEDHKMSCDSRPPHHTYCGEFDAIVRDKETGLLQLFETKTERRGSKANLPQAWAARSQVGLYLWAAEQIYGESFKNILLNVCTRQSPAGQKPASFRRDELQRSIHEKQYAVENIIWVANQIEAMEQQYGTRMWPQDRNVCTNDMTGWKCDYYDLHVVARGERADELVQIKFQPAEEYLAL